MFTRHDNEFLTCANPSTQFLPYPQTSLCISAETRLDTPTGWKEAKSLGVNERVASLDGGFVKVRAVQRVRSKQKAIFVPAGTLGSCADVFLPSDARVILTSPPGLKMSEAPFVSACIADMVGYKGIRSTLFGLRKTLALTFDEEEIIWAQTGLMLHVHPIGEGFYRSLDYGETRAILALIDHSACGADLSDVTSVTKYDRLMTG